MGTIKDTVTKDIQAQKADGIVEKASMIRLWNSTTSTSPMRK